MEHTSTDITDVPLSDREREHERVMENIDRGRCVHEDPFKIYRERNSEGRNTEDVDVAASIPDETPADGNESTVSGTDAGSIVNDRSVRYFRRREGPRVITVGYKIFPDKDENNVMFASTIFKTKEVDGLRVKTSVFTKKDRKGHIATVQKRLLRHPGWATYVFTPEVKKNMASGAASNKNKEERKAWSQTEEGKDWVRIRRKHEKDLVNFVRKAVGKHKYPSSKPVKKANTIVIVGPVVAPAACTMVCSGC